MCKLELDTHETMQVQCLTAGNTALEQLPYGIEPSVSQIILWYVHFPTAELEHLLRVCDHKDVPRTN